MITLEGDTLQADILNASDNKNTFGFKHKSSANGNRHREYKPGDVKAVIYGNEKYVSAQISDQPFSQEIFLKQLIESEVSLYKAVDAAGKTHFFFKAATGDFKLLHPKTYSGLLKVNLMACATTDFDDPNFMRKYGYHAAGLSKFFIAYNSCAFPGAPIIEHRNKVALYFTKGVSVGVASTAVSLTSMVAKPGEYGTYGNLNAGVYGELHIGRHLSTLLELQYHSYEGQFLDPEAFYPDEIYITMKYVRVPLLLRYATAGKIKFFANAGPHAERLLNQSGRRNYSNIEMDYTLDFAALSYGVTGGAGVALSPFSNKSELKFEGRYSKTTLQTSVNPCGTLAAYQLLVGFSF